MCLMYNDKNSEDFKHILNGGADNSPMLPQTSAIAYFGSKFWEHIKMGNKLYYYFCAYRKI